MKPSFAEWLILFVMALALGFVGGRVSAYEVRYPDTRGGYLHQFIATVNEANRNGEEIRITSSKCYSSCTIYLGADRMCTTRRTVFGFHCAQRGGKCATDLYQELIAEHIGRFSPSLSAFFLQGPASSKRLVKVSGATMIDHYGAREC